MRVTRFRAPEAAPLRAGVLFEASGPEVVAVVFVMHIILAVGAAQAKQVKTASPALLFGQKL